MLKEFKLYLQISTPYLYLPCKGEVCDVNGYQQQHHRLRRVISMTGSKGISAHSIHRRIDGANEEFVTVKLQRYLRRTWNTWAVVGLRTTRGCCIWCSSLKPPCTAHPMRVFVVFGSRIRFYHSFNVQRSYALSISKRIPGEADWKHWTSNFVIQVPLKFFATYNFVADHH